MALFGKSSGLPGLLKQVKAKAWSTPAERDALLGKVAEHPEARTEALVDLLDHPDRKVQEFVLDRLSNGAPDASLLNQMLDRPAPVRARLAEILSSAPPSELNAALGPWISSRKAEKREAGLLVIGAHPQWEAFLPQLKLAVADPVAQNRREAIRILSRGVTVPSVFLLLRDLINDEDEVVRSTIIEGMARHPSPDIVEPFFDRLAHEGPREQGLMVDALATVAASADDAFGQRLLPFLGDEQQSMREAAVGLLKLLPDQARVLRGFFEHGRGLAPWLRERATSSILQVAEDIVPTLLELMADEDEAISVEAMTLAATLGDERVIPAAREIFLSDCDWSIRNIAADVLGTFGREDVIELLLAHVENRDLRCSVVAALGKTRNPVVIPTLIGCLQDRRRSVRAIALDALASGYVDPDIKDAVAAVARGDPVEAVRERALLFLAKLDQRTCTQIQRMIDLSAEPEPEGEPGLLMENDLLNPTPQA